MRSLRFQVQHAGILKGGTASEKYPQFSSVQFSRSVLSNSLLPHGLQHVRPPCPSATPGACSNSTEFMMPSNHLIPSSPSPPAFNLSHHQGFFFNESVCHIRWPKYWSFSISASNKYSGLISFRMDLLDLLAVQETLKSFLQHHSSKASVLRCSALWSTHPYMTTGKPIALTRWTFVGKVINVSAF